MHHFGLERRLLERRPRRRPRKNDGVDPERSLPERSSARTLRSSRPRRRRPRAHPSPARSPPGYAIDLHGARLRESLLRSRPATARREQYLGAISVPTTAGADHTVLGQSARCPRRPGPTSPRSPWRRREPLPRRDLGALVLPAGHGRSGTAVRSACLSSLFRRSFRRRAATRGSVTRHRHGRVDRVRRRPSSSPRSGQPDIPGEFLQVGDGGGNVRSPFSTSPAPSREHWDLVVTNPNIEIGHASLAASSSKRAVRHDLCADLIGRTRILRGRDTTFYVVFGNRGTVDALRVDRDPRGHPARMPVGALRSSRSRPFRTTTISTRTTTRQIPLVAPKPRGTEPASSLFPIVPAGSRTRARRAVEDLCNRTSSSRVGIGAAVVHDERPRESPRLWAGRGQHVFRRPVELPDRRSSRTVASRGARRSPSGRLRRPRSGR